MPLFNDSVSQSASAALPPGGVPLPSSSQSQAWTYSSNESQETDQSNGNDRVFTPQGSESGSSGAAVNGDASSQESQLLQLSQLAAAQEKLPTEGEIPLDGQSKKRMADGMVKHTRQDSNTSPIRAPGHSRHTSTVSMASNATSGSRVSEVRTHINELVCLCSDEADALLQVSAELKARLSYAMVKVSHGWHAHTIGEVESLASQAASPTSSTSTMHGHLRASASPQLPLTSNRCRSDSATSSPVVQPPILGRPRDCWPDPSARSYPPSAVAAANQTPSLAPPASIQPRQQSHLNGRRNSNPKYSPSFLSHSHQASPHTPVQPSPLQSTPGARNMPTPLIDPILFSPHRDVREKEALETLMFMSSPGNSANLKHTFPSSQAGDNQRTALPSSRLAHGAQRKPLPGLRPTHGSPVKRVEFDASPTTMEIDDVYGSARQTPRRRTNGGGSRPPLSVPAGLSGPARPRPALNDDDIERMLDRVAKDDDSDSEGDLPLSRDRQRESTGVAA